LSLERNLYDVNCRLINTKSRNSSAQAQSTAGDHNYTELSNVLARDDVPHAAPDHDWGRAVTAAHHKRVWRPKRHKGTSPHRDIDLNYDGPGQSGLNLLHPAIHPPVDDWLARLFKLVR
jgi:hypothetical protein